MSGEVPLALVVKVLDEATAPLRRIQGEMEKRFGAPLKNISAAAGKVRDEFSALATRVGAVSIGGAVALAAFVKSSVDAGDALGEVSQRVGLTVDAFASLRFAAAQADVSSDDFTGGLDRLNKQLGEAKAGGGSLLKFLGEVGPGFAKQFRAASNMEEAIALLTTAFERVQDPQRRALLATEAFGRGAAQFGQFLGQGSAAIQLQQRRYLELVGSQERFVAGAGALDNAMREASTAFEGLRNVTASALFPALTKLATKVADFMASNRESLAAWADASAESFGRWLDSGGFERTVAGLARVADAVVRVVDTLGPWNVAVGAAALRLVPFAAAVASLAGTIAGPLASAVGGLVPLMAKAWPLLTAASTALAGWAAPLGAAALAFAPFLAGATGVLLAVRALRDGWEDLRLIFGQWDWKEQFRFASDGVRELLGADGMREAVSTSSEARVAVSFDNLPRGARVSTPRGSAPVSLDVGYSGAFP